MTRETVILVRNPDDDIVAVVRPVDALNPEFTAAEIQADPDLDAEIVSVTSLQTFLDYGKK